MRQGIRNITSINIRRDIKQETAEEIIAACPILNQCKISKILPNNEKPVSIRSQNDHLHLFIFSNAEIHEDCKSRTIFFKGNGKIIVGSAHLRELKCGYRVKRLVDFRTNPRVVKVEFLNSAPCTIVYKPEFILKKGKLSRNEFNDFWKKYMAGEVDLKEKYPYKEEEANEDEEDESGEEEDESDEGENDMEDSDDWSDDWSD